MKRLSLLAIALASAGIASGCAHVRVGDPSLRPVRVTRNEADVQGCQMISKLRAAAGPEAAVRSELENLTRSREGNVLLLSEGEAAMGTAYRCQSLPETGGR